MYHSHYSNANNYDNEQGGPRRDCSPYGQPYDCCPYGQPYYPRADYSRGYDAGKTFVAAAGCAAGAILCYYLLKKIHEK